MTAKLPAVLEAHPMFATLGIERGELELLVAGRPSCPAFVEALFDWYGTTRGKRFVGDETPGYVLEIGLLNVLFPSARFVHLLRDGRDVCLSAVGWRRRAEQFPAWDEAPVTTAALWWRRHVMEGRAAGCKLASDLYLELRYERLVSEPERECRRLCAFLDVAFDSAMLRFHEGRTRFGPGLSAKRAWLPPTPGLRDWTTRMPHDQLEEFEAAAGDALDAFGYPRAAPAPGANPVRKAAEVAAVFPRPEGR